MTPRLVGLGTTTMLAALAVVGGCSRGPNLDKLPEGTEVTLIRQDGGVVEGSLERVAPVDVTVRVGHRPRTVPRSQISEIQVNAPGDQPRALPPTAKFREVDVPAATTIAVRVLSSLASNTSRVEDQVRGELAEAIRIDDDVVVPSGAQVTGVVTRAQASAKVKGLAHLGFRLVTLRAGSDRYDIRATYARTARATKASDAKKIGIPAAGGAILGGILGGKKGAVIGGAIGGGAGTAAVLATSGKEVVIPAGTVLHLALGRDIEVKVAIR